MFAVYLLGLIYFCVFFLLLIYFGFPAFHFTHSVDRKTVRETVTEKDKDINGENKTDRQAEG